jgi:hypothetical protein
MESDIQLVAEDNAAPMPIFHGWLRISCSKPSPIQDYSVAKEPKFRPQITKRAEKNVVGPGKKNGRNVEV